MSNDFEEAAARGKQAREAREHAEAERQHRADDEAERKSRRERQRIVWWTCSIGGMFKAELGWLYLFIASAFVLTPITIFAIVELRPSPEIGALLFPGHRKVIPIPTIVAAMLLWLWGTAARRGYRRERAWMKSHPFQIAGYEGCIGDRSKDNEREIKLYLSFAGSRPTDDQLRDLLSGDGGSWKVDQGVATRDPGVGSGYRNYEQNRAVRSWFHKLVRKQLLPLHASHPITRVELRNHNGDRTQFDRV